MNKQRGHALPGLLVLSVWVIGVGAWCANIYKLIVMAQNDTVVQITLMMVLRIIGIFMVPLGVVLGCF